MRWATRAGVHIDRAACAWLIRRFLDPQAQFVFVTDPADIPADATGLTQIRSTTAPPVPSSSTGGTGGSLDRG